MTFVVIWRYINKTEFNLNAAVQTAEILDSRELSGPSVWEATLHWIPLMSKRPNGTTTTVEAIRPNNRRESLA